MQLDNMIPQPAPLPTSPLPYVVSGDTYSLLSDWAAKSRFKLPPKIFFEELQNAFKRFMTQIFPGFELIEEEEIKTGISAIRNKLNGLPVISLDRVYTPNADVYVDITRCITGTELTARGLGRRFEESNLLRQIRQLKEFSGREVLLVDDVVFSGELIKRLCSLLKMIQVNVYAVCTGIGIETGVENIMSNPKDALPRQVLSVREYKTVIDEVCERDFYPGLPQSGRSIFNEGNTGVPYILPFGKPEEWASIPSDWSKAFSEFCLNQTRNLYQEIEDVSNRSIYYRDLERKVIGWKGENCRVIDLIDQSLQQL